MPKSLEEWFKTSIKLDQQNRDCQAVLARQKAEKTEKESFSYSDPPIISSKPRTALTPTQDQNQKPVYSYCRKEGHRKEECRKRMNLCMKCGEAGHMAKTCGEKTEAGTKENPIIIDRKVAEKTWSNSRLNKGSFLLKTMKEIKGL